MKTLILRPKKCAPGDGYGAFCPESNAFQKINGGAIVEIEAQRMTGTLPNSEAAALKKQRRIDTLAAIRANPEIDALAIFCHGWTTGFQFGFNTQNIGELAKCLREGRSPIDLTVTLYACGCGDGMTNGDGGVADELRDALCKSGLIHCRVDAHTTAGHTSRNPWVRRFDGEGSPIGGQGGQWIVGPGSKLWSRWRKALQGDLRFRYPYMEIGDIHEELLSS